MDISNYFQFQYIDNKYIELKPIDNLMSDQLCLVNIKVQGQSLTQKVLYVNKQECIKYKEHAYLGMLFLFYLLSIL